MILSFGLGKAIDDRIEEIARLSLNKNRDLIPIKTGNLRYNATKLIPGKRIKVYIDRSIAPYGEYINRPGYKTEGWWENFVGGFVNDLVKNLNSIGPTTIKRM